ncbi:MAG: response regulator [Clostridiales Family XIII bacterium]|jgi:signal transduction histidine kinase/CheY-like chemotaxis protein|nr:response regulator [Clostridiales Family XIII bacterium]
MKNRSAVSRSIKPLALIFAAFLVMILVSFFFVSDIIGKLIQSTAEELLDTSELIVYSDLHETEILLQNLSFSTQNRIGGGASNEDIKNVLTDYRDWLEQSGHDSLGFISVYGYIRGEYISDIDRTPRGGYEPSVQPWYTEAERIAETAAAGGIAYSSIHINPSTNDVVISASKSLRGEAGEDYGVLALDLRITKMSNNIAELDITKNGYGMLLDQNLTFIAHPDKYYQGKNLADFGDGHANLAARLRNGETEVSAVKLVNREGAEIVTFFRQLPNGWYAGIATPVESYYRDMYLMAFILSVLGVFFVLTFCFLIIRLNKERMRADAENVSKSSFLAKMSHEIRTPMNSVLGMSELIMRNNISDEVREHALVIRQAGNNLISIINDILDFSKIESGQVRIEPQAYSVASLVNDTVNMIRVRLMDKELDFLVRVNPNIPASLLGDRTRVQQILVNLLGNAVKYTQEGFVALEIDFEQMSGRELKLICRVSDSGIGIREEEIGGLFNEFSRLDTKRNQRVEGSGLGLAIAVSLCRVMGGGITVSSEYGKGSVFTASIVQPYEGGGKLAAAEGADRKRALLYEERPRYFESLLRALQELGLTRIHAARSLREFMEEIKSDRYDYAFISSAFAADCALALGESNARVRPVFMVELRDASVFQSVSGIIMPVTSIAIANILNGAPDDRYHRAPDRWSGFTAESARILIVDDMTMNLRVAVELMKPYGMEIQTCGSGSEALELVKNNRYDLVFMDHMMPDMDGAETAAEIRKLGAGDPHCASLPIIMLTANVASGRKDAFLKAGIDDILAKPIETQKLNGILKKWIPAEKQTEAPQGEGIDAAGLENFTAAGLDVLMGIRNAGGSVPAYMDILSDFCKDAQTKGDDIESAVKANDIPAYIIATHGLKGASRSVGAPGLADFAARMEEAGAGGRAEVIRGETGALLKQLRYTVQNIRTALLLNAPAGRGGDGIGIAEPQLRALKRDLLNMDIEAVNERMIEFTNLPLNAGSREAVSDIEQSILLFEYDKAIEKIDGFGAGRA